MSCLVIIELENGKPNRPSLSTISAAKKLSNDLDVLILESDNKETVATLTDANNIFYFASNQKNILAEEIVDILIPMKNAFLRMPIVATFILFMGAGYIIGGIRSAIVVGSFTLFIALTEWWDRALITMYMATFGVIVSGILGITIGTLSAQNKTSSRIAIGVCVGIGAIWAMLSLTINLVVVVFISSLEGSPKEVSVELQAAKR